MSLNPPAPPKPRGERLTKAVGRALHGQEFALGMVVGFLLALLSRIVGG